MSRQPLVALIAALIGVAGHSVRLESQVRDTTAARDSARGRARTPAALLAPVEVRASIIPAAGPTIGSGVPARITIVSGRQLDGFEARTLPSVLAASTGVSVYDDLGSPYKLNLSTRGFTAGPTVGLPAGVTVFLDGVRQNEPDAQEVNFDLLPMDEVDRVELLSGTASLLGPNSLGGAVNLVTARGDAPPSAELEVGGGSFGGWSTAGRIGARTASGWDVYASAGLERERGWRDATGARAANVFANLGRTSADGERGATLQLLGARSRASTAGSLPESIFAASPRTNFTAGDVDDLDAHQVAFSGRAPLWRGDASASTHVRRSSAERFNVNQAPDPDVRGFTDNLTIGGSADWRWMTRRGARSLAIRGGLDGAFNRVRVRIFTEPSGGAPGGGGRELTTHVTSPSVDLAAYAVGDLSLGRATVSLGARWDRVHIPFRDELDPTGADSVSDYARLSPRGGVSVNVGRGVTAYASAGESFRAPAILELGCADPEASCPLPFALGDDPPLAPVRATNYEAGVRALLPWGAALLDLSAYRTEVRDEIFFVASDQALLSGYFTNLDRTRREGVEASLAGEGRGGRLRWYASHAWTVATFRVSAALASVRSEEEFDTSPLAGPNAVSPGDRLPLVPARQAKGGATWRAWRALELGADVRWTGEQWLRGDEANETRPLSSYASADVRLSTGVGPWTLSAVVTNLLDARRATFGTFNENRATGALERFLTPMSARSVRITLSLLGGAREGRGESNEGVGRR